MTEGTKMGEATARPWRVEEDQHFGPGYVITAVGMGNRCPVVRMQSPFGDEDAALKSDALLIVEAVNSYDTLQARIRDLEAREKALTEALKPMAKAAANYADCED